jgi:alanyl-tRNA synthetase
VLQLVLWHAKTQGKAAYLFGLESDAHKVTHLNYLPKPLITKEFDARTWATKVSEVLGGKVRSRLSCSTTPHLIELPQAGGKDDTAQGVGSNVGKVDEGLALAKSLYISRLSN